MSKIICGQECKNLPWEDCPKGYERPVWRYSKNPITKREYSATIDRTMNSSLISFNNEFIGVFRADNYCNRPNIYVGHSKDGINIVLDKEPIKMIDLEGNEVKYESRFDPRITILEGIYYITYCDYANGEVTTSIAKTSDFKTFIKLDNPFTPNYRNGVLFPKKIDGKYKILLRPCDAGDSLFGNIHISESPDLVYFGKSKPVCQAGFSGWNWVKIGPGPAPIEIEEGWLVFIHGVTKNCSGYVYSMGAIILDKDEPSKVLYKCKDALLMPVKDYEVDGFTNNVCFPTSALVDSETGRIAIYYGAADSVIALAFTTIDKLVDYIKKNSK